MKKTVWRNVEAHKIRKASLEQKLKQTLAVILTAIMFTVMISGRDLSAAAAESTEAVDEQTEQTEQAEQTEQTEQTEQAEQTISEEDVTTEESAGAAAAAAAVQPAINALLPVSSDRIADILARRGYGVDIVVADDAFRQQLTAVSAFSNTVRFYGSAGELYKAYKIAHEMGFTVVGTAYLSGVAADDKAEMNALIEHCNNGYVKVACVGNETLLKTSGGSSSLTASQLIADIQYVRGKLKDSSIPVTTSDTVEDLLSNPSVIDACNLIMPNCHPYWGGAAVDSAAEVFISKIDQLKAVSGGKQILVSETGWPTAGQTVGGAVPNEGNAAKYFDEIRKWSLSTGTQVLFFDAADEPWKAEGGEEGSAGRRNKERHGDRLRRRQPDRCRMEFGPAAAGLKRASAEIDEPVL